MPTIAAANNLTIHSEGDTWTLLNGISSDGAPPAGPIVKANMDGLTYDPAFGTARRLPGDGFLPAEQIAMVVVGWAVEDSSWHLGLMVTPDLAQSRGGRWCGLARWNGDDGDNAATAGEQLARMLAKPFRVVQPPAQKPKPEPVVLPPDAPPPPDSLPEMAAVPTPPLMPLPIVISEWSLHETDNGLLWKHSKGWRNKTLLNTFFFALLTAIFGALSFGARFSPFAPVQPEWLPLVGLALTALLAILVIWQGFSLTRATSVLIDNQQGLIRVLRGYNEKAKRKSGRTVMQAPYEGIEYVLVSQVISRHEAVRSNNPLLPPFNRIWPEMWVHLYSPRRGFIPACYVTQTEGRMRADIPPNVRRPLDLSEIDTPAHHAALYMAEMIGVPAYVETR